MKVLIIRFSSIGDIVLTTPIVRCVKKQLKADVYFVTKQKFVATIGENKFITKIYTFNNHLAEIEEDLINENFDIVIDLHKNIRSKKLALKLKKKVYSFDKLNIKKWILTNFKINLLPKNLHIVDRYFEGIKSLGVSYDGVGLDYFVNELDDQYGKMFLHENGEYATLVLGANYYTKRIPLEICSKIIEKSKLKIVLLGGIDVADEAKALKEKFSNKIISLVSKTNLNQSAAIIKYANKVFTSDTGLMHIAAAYNKEIEIYWGSTDKIFGMYPFMSEYNENKVIHKEVLGLSCRPCSKIGYDRCPKGHFKCMLNQDI